MLDQNQQNTILGQRQLQEGTVFVYLHVLLIHLNPAKGKRSGTPVAAGS